MQDADLVYFLVLSPLRDGVVTHLLEQLLRKVACPTFHLRKIHHSDHQPFPILYKLLDVGCDVLKDLGSYVFCVYGA